MFVFSLECMELLKNKWSAEEDDCCCMFWQNKCLMEASVDESCCAFLFFLLLNNFVLLQHHQSHSVSASCGIVTLDFNQLEQAETGNGCMYGINFGSSQVVLFLH